MPSPIESNAWPDRLGDASQLTELLLEWQAIGEPECFEQICRIVSPVVLRIAGRALARAGLRSHSLGDDVLSLVLDHLRRLYAPAQHAQPVARFLPEPDGSAAAGPRYVCWLTLARARDVIRSERRRSDRHPSFTDLDLSDFQGTARDVPPPISSADDSAQLESLHSAIAALDEAARCIVEMLLAGRSQKQIADALGVCEGTVSRRKDRAFLQIRDVIMPPATAPDANSSHRSR